MKIAATSLHFKIRAALVLAGGAILILAALALRSERALLIQERADGLHRSVATAHAVVAHYQDLAALGQLGEAQAKETARAAVKDLRFNQHGYFWIVDLDARMVMHPVRPELDGTDVGRGSTPEGRHVYRELIALARHGGGMVAHTAEDGGTGAPASSISYAKGCAPWGWVIGAAASIEDIQATVTARWKAWGLAVCLLLGALLLIDRVLIGALVKRHQRALGPAKPDA